MSDDEVLSRISDYRWLAVVGLSTPVCLAFWVGWWALLSLPAVALAHPWWTALREARRRGLDTIGLP